MLEQLEQIVSGLRQELGADTGRHQALMSAVLSRMLV